MGVARWEIWPSSRHNRKKKDQKDNKEEKVGLLGTAHVIKKRKGKKAGGIGRHTTAGGKKVGDCVPGENTGRRSLNH